MTSDNFNYLWGRRHDIRVRVLSNLLYQQERQKIMERRDNAIKALNLMSGTAIFAQWTAFTPYIKWLAAIIVMASLISFVFSFSTKARDASKRAAEWNSLNQEIERVGERDFTETLINKWAARSSEIELGETAANEALLLSCYIKACGLLKSEPSKNLTKIQRLKLFRLIP